MPTLTPTKTQTNLTRPKLELRDYQKKVIGEIYHHYRKGVKSVMLVSPTGSGKTLTTTHIISDAVNRGVRVLFIIHREPLVDQTVKTLNNYGVDSVGYIKAGYPHANDEDRVIVASIQTLARRDYPPNIGLVIFDESHTTSFYKTAKKLIDYYCESPIIPLSKAKFLHLTATPFRLKRKEYFGNHVQAIVQAPHIGQLIRKGYLTTARHFGYNGLTDFSKLETGHDGDYKTTQVQGVCQQLEYNQAVVRKYLEICPDRKAISFAASVEQSLLLAELFNQEGIKAEQIQAETTTEERKAIFNQLKHGEIQILSSVGTLTEGFDEPSIEAVILARPTNSLALLIQMCGRGLRLFPNKKDCYLLDFGENFKRLGRVDTKRKISLCPKPPQEELGTKECPNCQEIVNKLVKICPHCGYIFGLETSEKEKDERFIEGVFGELLDREMKQRLRYIRSQRKMRFTKGLHPDHLWELWDQKYPGEILCNDWLYGAVFKGDGSSLAQKEFVNYLHEFWTNPHPNWVKFHLAIEFNNPKYRVESKGNERYAFPPNSMVQSWWQVLELDPFASFDEIEMAYTEQVAISQDDDLLMAKLNRAYDQAMHFRAVKLGRESHHLMANLPIDYGTLIDQINQQMRRLRWSKKRGLEYILAAYGKHSRQLLSDEQLISFLEHLTNL